MPSMKKGTEVKVRETGRRFLTQRGVRFQPSSAPMALPRTNENLLPVSLTFTSVPFFMLGMLMIYIFAYGLKWFEPTGAAARGITQAWTLEYILTVIHHAILPASAIVLASMGGWALGMRGMMITNDGEDYIILAQAKG